ncbi:MAG: L-aspartate oxidase [Cyanobacteria bacterium J06632_22]
MNAARDNAVPETALEGPFDVLVIGGGAAGLYSALCIPNHLSVALLTKETLSKSASDWAQGGIAAAIAPDDHPQLHIIDTLKAGAGLCEPEAVALLVHQAKDCIDALVHMGVAFDREGSKRAEEPAKGAAKGKGQGQAAGALAMTLEAAHSRRRVLHAADTTGRAVVTTLAEQVRQRGNIQIFNEAFALDLWIGPSGRCQGAAVAYQQQIHWVQAGAVVLATGGGGQVYAQTTNPPASTGDGVAMAWRAGAQLRDLEFMQFHPTALTQPGAPHFLISEAVRGEGAHLVDAAGHRFAFDYHPDGELAPRDVVSRAIFSYLQRPEVPSPVVWLDLSSIAPDRVRHRFPNIIRKCQKWAGIDILQTPIPVSPAAHYWMGGIVTDLTSRTTIPGLYAVGENASTGVHGANRLASNSLLECLVFGAQLRQLAPTSVEATSDTTTAPLAAVEVDLAQLDQIQTAIAQLVWQTAGISREAAGLKGAIQQLKGYQREFDRLPLTKVLTHIKPGQPYQLPPTLDAAQLRAWGELQNLLKIADLILHSALFRTESRGGHYRSDFPESIEDWRFHTLVRGDTCRASDPVPESAQSPLAAE